MLAAGVEALGNRKAQATQGDAPGIRRMGPCEGHTTARDGGLRGGGISGEAAGGPCDGHKKPGRGSCAVGNNSGEGRSGTTAGGRGLSVRCCSNAAAGLRGAAC